MKTATNYRFFYSFTFDNRICYKDVLNYKGNLTQLEAKVKTEVNKSFGSNCFKFGAIHEILPNHTGLKLLK
jgi:hypothetical protein